MKLLPIWVLCNMTGHALFIYSNLPNFSDDEDKYVAGLNNTFETEQDGAQLTRLITLRLSSSCNLILL